MLLIVLYSSYFLLGFLGSLNQHFRYLGGERRLRGILTQSFSDHFPGSEFSNSHT